LPVASSRASRTSNTKPTGKMIAEAMGAKGCARTVKARDVPMPEERSREEAPDQQILHRQCRLDFRGRDRVRDQVRRAHEVEGEGGDGNRGGGGGRQGLCRGWDGQRRIQRLECGGRPLAVGVTRRRPRCLLPTLPGRRVHSALLPFGVRAPGSLAGSCYEGVGGGLRVANARATLPGSRGMLVRDG
jgi:hypothetical protein